MLPKMPEPHGCLRVKVHWGEAPLEGPGRSLTAQAARPQAQNYYRRSLEVINHLVNHSAANPGKGTWGRLAAAGFAPQGWSRDWGYALD